MDLTPALNLIKEFEGCRLEAYWDPNGHVWTIGWGHTGGVKGGETCTQAQADQWLLSSVKSFAAGVQSLIHVPISNNELCALTSFSYNLGIGTLIRSTLLEELNQSEPIEVVAEQFKYYDHSGGEMLPGLLRRRQAEAKLFVS